MLKVRLYYLIQRYKFESNSQLIGLRVLFLVSCIIWYKDTNLKAIHNHHRLFIAEGMLFIWYKDTNLKAIHNFILECLGKSCVVLSDTKIQIWKQFTTEHILSACLPCCIIWYKDTNLKAIHNYCVDFSCHSLVVLSDTKIQIWKQFTTVAIADIHLLGLYYLIQRYKFESNSQPLWKSTTIQVSCIIWYKGLYYLIQRYKFESNSQRKCQ